MTAKELKKLKKPSLPKRPSMHSTAGWLIAIRRLAHNIAKGWAPLLVLLILATGLLGYRLGSLQNLSPIENQTIADTSSYRTIGGEPLNLPYKLLEFATLHLPFGSLEVKARLASVILALACVALFYLIVQRWHGVRNATMATFLFATSGWLLHAGRFGSGLIMLTFTVLALVAAATWLNNSNKETDGGLSVLSFVAACILALFVPAGIWFVLPLAFMLRKKLFSHISALKTPQLVPVYVVMALSVGLIAAALARNPDQAAQWLGVPIELPDLPTLGRYAAGSVLYLFARGPFMPELWLAHTPLLDAATAAMLLLGVLFYAKRWTNVRARLLGVGLLISAILITVQGPYALAYLAPLAYLIAATGLAYLLYEWSRVFPRNPIARNLALALVVVLTLGAATYHTQRYFVAWHYSPDTAKAYQSTRSEMPLNLLQ